MSKVLVITTSLRTKSNSDILAESLIKGAQDAGHEVEHIVTREDVFITSKIYGGNYERAGGIIDDALKDLNVDYIDLLLIHQPGYDDEGVYKAMEDAVRAGKLRSIGISNYYTKAQVDEVLAFATIVPAVIQNENNL